MASLLPTAGAGALSPKLGSRKFPNIVDRQISRGKTEVSLSAFAFLFSELVQYSQTRVNTTGELERKLEDAGYQVGLRMLELITHRERSNKRETKIVPMLTFVSNTVWKVLFGKAADSLERHTEHEDEYAAPLPVCRGATRPAPRTLRAYRLVCTPFMPLCGYHECERKHTHARAEQTSCKVIFC